MKLGPDVLLEIVNIVQMGILDQKDVSENLRSLDLEVDPESGKLVLSSNYTERMTRKN